MPFRLTKNDGDDIGFALICLSAGALHFSEFKDWLYLVIEQDDSPPAYVFDMLDVTHLVDFKPQRLMGFVPTTELSAPDNAAMAGIGFRRGIIAHDDVISRTDALDALDDNPQLEQRVAAVFPFLDLTTIVGPDPDRGW